jgi:Leucine-rich repeat (LRR) protein
MLYKVDINFKRTNGETCLHIACSERNISSAKWILKEGIRINAKDSQGQTALMKTLSKSRTNESPTSCSTIQMIQFLLMNNADPKLPDEKNQTLIHKAVFSEHCEVISFLKSHLKNDSFVELLNVKDIDGKTALHYAVLFEKTKCLKVLLECGIKTETLDNYQQSALHLALKSDKIEICHMIKKDLSVIELLKYNEVSQGQVLNLDASTSATENKLNKKHIQNVTNTSFFSQQLFKNHIWLISLNLSGNNVVSIPSSNLQKLSVLSLKNNNLREPPSLESLVNLSDLDLSENQLQLAPPKLSKLLKLKKINLSFNEFKVWPSELNALKSIEEIDISFNNISFDYGDTRKSMDLSNVLSPRGGKSSNQRQSSFFSTRDSIRDSLSTSLSELQSKISFNNSSEKPQKKTNISKSLKILNISSNGIMIFPVVLLELENLETLDISSNNIGDIPTKLTELANLTELNISNCGIIKFPRNLSYSKLKKLNLSNNPISSVPPVIIEGIEILHINNCQFQDISQFIENNKTLKIVNARDNKIADFPSFLGNNMMEKLDLSGNLIEDITEAIDEFENLTHLDLSKNILANIHKNFNSLVKLKYLNLSTNQLQFLPDECFEDFVAMEELDLSDNQFTEIPNVSKLTNLKKLNLENNFLGSIPKGLNKLINLNQLNLSNNQLNSCKGVFDCLKLTNLKLNGNLLTSLDSGIYKLKNLKMLNLDDNEIQRIPNSIIKLNSLEKFSIRNNSNEKVTDELLNWISYNRIQFEDFCHYPIKIIDSLWVSSIGIANNLTILKENNISNIVWLIENPYYTLRIQHPEDLSHKVIRINSKIDLEDFFVEATTFVQETPGETMFCSDSGFEFSSIFIVAFIMISKGISLRNAMPYLKAMNDVEISNEYLGELIKFDKSKYVSFLKSELRILLENENERENFKEFAEEEK